ncbi:MAG: DUF4159 domain-containing protein, partial [Hyphomicrobiales bacterium]|nr:DUF4159 domain-containing protein [Hyphomicrobiales bacterium]
GDPVAVDPAHDELAFYPLIYWPVSLRAPVPTQAVRDRIGAFMRGGGTILFDTRDALEERPDGEPTPRNMRLRDILKGVDVPPLEPVPSDHVLTKTFYLLRSLVGRYAIGTTFVERLPPPDPRDLGRPVRPQDGVSPVIVTSNDLASAWATDASGAPLYPLTPGGDRQRELALRAGVNIVLYTLTGTYKADQVHMHDILQRLGR